MERIEINRVHEVERQLRWVVELKKGERITCVFIEEGIEDPVAAIMTAQFEEEDCIASLHSRDMYDVIAAFYETEVRVETRYKTVDRKVKSVAGPLPKDVVQHDIYYDELGCEARYCICKEVCSKVWGEGVKCATTCLPTGEERTLGRGLNFENIERIHDMSNSSGRNKLFTRDNCELSNS